jgi:S-adenosylmethionine:tRNA ribosyltransferase-isomerase
VTYFEQILKRYNYTFPQELIAQAPAHPRDSARLLVFNRIKNQISHDIFKSIGEYLPKNSVLVLNQTKVIPARLTVTKPTGGQARLLYIKHESRSIFFLSDRKLEIGTKITAAPRVNFRVTRKEGQFYILQPSFPASKIISVLEKYGSVPLPPYIKHSQLKGQRLKNEYQTVFAKQSGSVAAPTASLHFTKSLLKKLANQGVAIKYVTLHVNLGTFAPVTEQQIKNKQLHSEPYEITASTAKFLNKAKQQHRPIIAVGTTVVRTLESASNQQGKLTRLTSDTSLFITENYKPKFVDSLITNFHVPKSSLLMLVSAFTGRQQLHRIYKEAIKQRYRLFSFGDAMLII